VLLRADGVSLATVAQTVGGTQARVCNWTRAWRAQGAHGGGEGTHPGAERRLDAGAERVLAARVEEGNPQAHGYAYYTTQLPGWKGGNPQAHGYAATTWTAPWLRTELATQRGSASERTRRRTLHRLG
jgi:transposase